MQTRQRQARELGHYWLLQGDVALAKGNTEAMGKCYDKAWYWFKQQHRSVYFWGTKWT